MISSPSRPRGPSNRSLLRGLLLAAATLVVLLLPAGASAAEQTFTYRQPITIAGYEVKQGIMSAPHPDVDGYVTKMETDMVDEDGTPIPIDRLMLHHIVYLNLAQRDATCSGYTFWDSQPSAFGAPERFYAAGEERSKMNLPNGYGYPAKPSDPWVMSYMVMNHRAQVDSGYIQYTVTVSDDPNTTPVTPYWFDERNCEADPIYNVPGTGGKDSTATATSTFTMPESGRIVAGGGHTHGGAEKLTLTEPGCDDRKVAQSVPTWGLPDNPFYNVKPVLHEPGPIDMSAFGSEEGIPVRAGERLSLNSIYDNSRPHVRVMGIMITYVAADPMVTNKCEPVPDDIVIKKTDQPGRHEPVPFRIPLYNLDANNQAVRVKAPPGDLKKAASGTTVDIDGRSFTQPNIEVKAGSKVNWQFDGNEIHNVTLANGPIAIGSPNLNGGRVFTKTLRRPGTYRFFCALHPVQMTERVEVVAGKKKG